MDAATFQLPVWFDLTATFTFAFTGALMAVKRGYDIVGIFFLALATGLGGALVRDGVFLPSNSPTPLLTDPRYISTVAVAAVIGAIFGYRMKHFKRVVAVVDAVGLGAYAVFGMQKALSFGLSMPAALLVGVINAAGGGLLRDLLAGEVPLVFKPGQFYVLVALAGELVFFSLTQFTGMAPALAGGLACLFTFVFRLLTITFNWRTAPLVQADPDEDKPEK